MNLQTRRSIEFVEGHFDKVALELECCRPGNGFDRRLNIRRVVTEYADENNLYANSCMIEFMVVALDKSIA